MTWKGAVQNLKLFEIQKKSTPRTANLYPINLLDFCVCVPVVAGAQLRYCCSCQCVFVCLGSTTEALVILWSAALKTVLQGAKLSLNMELIRLTFLLIIYVHVSTRPNKNWNKPKTTTTRIGPSKFLSISIFQALELFFSWDQQEAADCYEGQGHFFF